MGTGSLFVGTSWVRGSYRNMHHNDGVIPKLETTPRTDGKVKGRDTPKDTPARLVYLRPMRRAALRWGMVGHGGWAGAFEPRPGEDCPPVSRGKVR